MNSDMTINEQFTHPPHPSPDQLLPVDTFAPQRRMMPRGYIVGYLLLLVFSVLMGGRYAIALASNIGGHDVASSTMSLPSENTPPGQDDLNQIQNKNKSLRVAGVGERQLETPGLPSLRSVQPRPPVGRNSTLQSGPGLAPAADNRVEGNETSAASNVAAPLHSVTPVTTSRHPAPLHEQMVTPGNFTYLGAFRPPHVSGMKSTFQYGGWSIAFDSHGDPTGADDGYPGSLYVVGHPNEELVAEISIPRPVISKSSVMDELSVAEVLQPFGDITGGIRAEMTQGSSEPFRIGGMHVIDDRLHWTLYKYYNVQTIDYPSHGVSSLSTTRPRPEGMWHLGQPHTGRSEWHSYKHAGYILEMPREFADKWFGGRNLMSGLQIATGLNIASHGPAMFAYQLPPRGTANGAALDAIPLVYNDIHRPAPGFNPADRWTGGAWLTVGDRETVIITGRKALGEVYYGEARPSDCSIDKGFHGAPYESQMLFYAPQALIAAAHGKMEPTQITPWYVWNQSTPGGGLAQYLFPSCNQHLGGIAYDRANHLLYLVQINAGTTSDDSYGVLPVIHIFRVD